MLRIFLGTHQSHDSTQHTQHIPYNFNLQYPPYNINDAGVSFIMIFNVHLALLHYYSLQVNQPSALYVVEIVDVILRELY